MPLLALRNKHYWPCGCCACSLCWTCIISWLSQYAPYKFASKVAWHCSKAVLQLVNIIHKLPRQHARARWPCTANLRKCTHRQCVLEATHVIGTSDSISRCLMGMPGILTVCPGEQQALLAMQVTTSRQSPLHALYARSCRPVLPAML